MTKTATLQSLKEQCLERRRRLLDEVVSVKSLFMDPSEPGRLIVRRPDGPESAYQMDRRVYRQAPSVVYGLPGSYLQKLVESKDGDLALAAQNFNHWVERSKPKEVLLRFEKKALRDGSGNVVGADDNYSVRAMLPATWNPIPYEASLDSLISKFGADKECQVTRFDDDSMVLDFIARRLDYESNPSIHERRDDPVEWGMRFRDSDSGIGPLEMSPYTRRLVCTNGATVVSEGIIMRISHTSKVARVLEEAMANVRQGVELIDGYSNRYAEQITASMGILLDVSGDNNHPEAALNRIARDCLVTKLEDKYVREAWDVEGEHVPEPSVWRLHNAFTRAGTHGSELEIDQKLKLQAVGGRILELSMTKYNWN